MGLEGYSKGTTGVTDLQVLKEGSEGFSMAALRTHHGQQQHEHQRGRAAARGAERRGVGHEEVLQQRPSEQRHLVDRAHPLDARGWLARSDGGRAGGCAKRYS